MTEPSRTYSYGYLNKTNCLGSLQDAPACTSASFLTQGSNLIWKDDFMISARNRDLSRRKALRKRRIANEIYRNHDSQGEYLPYYDNLHQYSKNKIHCSCPSGSAKTRNKGKRGQTAHGWNPSKNYKHSDLRKLTRLDYEDGEEVA